VRFRDSDCPGSAEDPRFRLRCPGSLALRLANLHGRGRHCPRAGVCPAVGEKCHHSSCPWLRVSLGCGLLPRLLLVVVVVVVACQRVHLAGPVGLSSMALANGGKCYCRGPRAALCFGRPMCFGPPSKYSPPPRTCTPMRAGQCSPVRSLAGRYPGGGSQSEAQRNAQTTNDMTCVGARAHRSVRSRLPVVGREPTPAG
jgi:hypothetical protein